MIRHDLSRRPRGYDLCAEILATIPPGSYASLRILADDFGVTLGQVRNAIRRLKERFDLVLTQTTVAIHPDARTEAERACETYWLATWDQQRN